MNNQLLEDQIYGGRLSRNVPSNDLMLVDAGRESEWVEPTPKQVIPSQRVGMEVGTQALERQAIDEEGYLWRMPSQDIQEVLSEGWYHQIKYMLKRGINWGSGIAAYIFRNSAGARRFRNKIRALRPKAPRGMEYRFNVAYDMWRLHPKQGLLFDHEGLTYTHGPYYRGRIERR